MGLESWATLVIALIGAILGVVNTWTMLLSNTVRLRVKPTFATSVPVGEPMFSISVVNLSSFAVTICEVGVALSSRGANFGKRAAIVQPLLIDGGAWPRRLEPRESVSVYFSPADLLNSGPLHRAYAMTACGEVSHGDSPALASLRELLKNRPQR